MYLQIPRKLVVFTNMIHHLLLKRILRFLLSILSILRRNIQAFEERNWRKKNEGQGVMHKRIVKTEKERQKKRENLSREIDR